MDNDLKNKTGESRFSRGSSYDDVQLNGDEGRFMLRRKDAERGEDGKYPKEDTGYGADLEYDVKTGKKIIKDTKPYSAVFLKIRRSLSYYTPSASARTSEHNGRHDRVFLYGPSKGQREVGIASELREKYPALHTQQIVYAWLPDADEVVRLTVKGASLGSEKEVKGATKFYDYLQTFKGSESVSQFVTEMWPLAEEGPKGTYFSTDFRRGRALDAEERAQAAVLVGQIHDELEAQDASLRERMGNETPAGEPKPETAPAGNEEPKEGLPYPDEEVNAEDIPF